jgi:hypothetical protein
MAANQLTVYATNHIDATSVITPTFDYAIGNHKVTNSTQFDSVVVIDPLEISDTNTFQSDVLA